MPINYLRKSAQQAVVYCLLIMTLFSCQYHDRQDVQVSDKPVVIEIIGKEGERLNTDLIFTVLQEHAVPDSLIYRWKNHFVLFGEIKNPDSLSRIFLKKLPDTEVKVYSKAFYEFNRKKHCGDAEMAENWNTILMTADMVKDTVLQREYLGYHQTQFEKWPEVAKGFCNADFQRLLLFKNGRQLMLAISIPKGKTLDELNPKTTADNPRVDEWNALMQKYQEGIAGTAEGEVWVVLKKGAR